MTAVMDPIYHEMIIFVITGVFGATFATLGLLRYAGATRSPLCPHCATRDTSIRWTVLSFLLTLISLLGIFALASIGVR